MSDIIKRKIEVFECEIGRPAGIEIELNRRYDIVTVSIGCYIKGTENTEKRIYIYEDYTDTDTVFINSIIELNAPLSYEGELIKIDWFLKIEADGLKQEFPFKTYPNNYFKYFERKQ